jgi:hypothetical protein
MIAKAGARRVAVGVVPGGKWNIAALIRDSARLRRHGKHCCAGRGDD